MSRDLFASNTVTLYQNNGYLLPKLEEGKQTGAHPCPATGDYNRFLQCACQDLFCSLIFLNQISIIQQDCLGFILKEQNTSYMQALEEKEYTSFTENKMD